MNKYMFVIWGLIVFIIFGVILTYGICYKKEHPYIKVEHTIEEKAEEYLDNYDGIKPDENIDVTITTKELIKTGYLTNSDLKYKGKKCSGKVVVSFENNKYIYNTKINCK